MVQIHILQRMLQATIQVEGCFNLCHRGQDTNILCINNKEVHSSSTPYICWWCFQLMPVGLHSSVI